MHRLEVSHWKRDQRRKTHAFSWGLEHIGGDPSDPDPKRFLLRYAEKTRRESEEYFATGPAPHYDLKDGVVSFPSAITSPYEVNNTVYCQWFPSEKANGRAVLVLPQWNSQPDSHIAICKWFQRVNISALRISLPYHDDRRPEKYERADPLVGTNIGLTLQANQQSVLDVRRALRWLEQQGHDRIGITGTSIGSAIAYIVMAHDHAIRVGAFLHVSTQFGDVVRTGMTTEHVWEGIKPHLTEDEIRDIWRPVSPFDYISRMKEDKRKILLISAKHDLSFVPELSCQLWQEMDRQGIQNDRLILPCGHYTLGKFPFNWIAGLRFIPYVRKHLSALPSSPKPSFEEQYSQAD